MKNIASKEDLGDAQLFPVTRVMMPKQLLEILALGKAIKVNALLEAKKSFSKQRNTSLKNLVFF